MLSHKRSQRSALSSFITAIFPISDPVKSALGLDAMRHLRDTIGELKRVVAYAMNGDRAPFMSRPGGRLSCAPFLHAGLCSEVKAYF